MNATGMSVISVLAIGVLIGGGCAASQTPWTQPLGVKRTELQRHGLGIPGREVVQALVELDPGVSFPRHSHPGEEIIYVLEGSWEYVVGDQPPVTLEAGDVLFIPAGTVHAARNVGSGQGVELATYVVETGKTLVMPAD